MAANLCITAPSTHWNSMHSLSSQQQDRLTRLRRLQGFLSNAQPRFAAATSYMPSSLLTHTPSVASVYNQADRNTGGWVRLVRVRVPSPWLAFLFNPAKLEATSNQFYYYVAVFNFQSVHKV